MPFSDRSLSNCSLLTKSRRTWACRSCFQSMRTAPRMWFLSYAAVSSSTSTRTTFGSSRCCSTHSASTSTSVRAIVAVLSLLLACSGNVTSERAAEQARQPEMHLAAEADVEGGVEDRGDERHSRRDRTEDRGADEVADGPDHCEQQADPLGEPRRCLRLELGGPRAARAPRPGPGGAGGPGAGPAGGRARRPAPSAPRPPPRCRTRPPAPPAASRCP